MVTEKQLKYILSEAQEIQKKTFGSKVGISIMTGCFLKGFVVTVEHNAETLPDGNLSSSIQEFEFRETMDFDECTDKFSELQNFINKSIDE